ncbi:CB1 cannabinoid receptor-interacting protein 1 domain-containing protein [Ditylenchus destructor]|nr:CB1 cannabinoid receptor-interacting protein 1 domain-containing protein [Ditylenchus destructor]
MASTIGINGSYGERKPSNALGVGVGNGERKLSNAELRKASTASALRKPSLSPIGTIGAGTSFQMMISLHNADTNDLIAFKQDGQRFGTSQRTLKLNSNLKYKCLIKTKPLVEFHHMHLGGSDLELVSETVIGGEYSAIWNTTGIDPTRKGARQDILLILSGPGVSLRKKIQTKFYNPGNGHAEWGHKLDSLIWQCDIDPTGAITVTDEQVL